MIKKAPPLLLTVFFKSINVFRYINIYLTFENHFMKNCANKELVRFLVNCTDLISSKTDDKILLDGNAEFLSKLKDPIIKKHEQKQVPVLSKLNMLAKTPYTFNFHDIANELTWRPSPRTDYEANFIALSSINEMLNLGGLVAGFLFMTPNQVYPEHSHNPQEFYFILSGNANWLYGDEKEYKEHKPGDLIYNRPNDLHGIKTENESLLALYLLWGNNVKDYSF